MITFVLPTDLQMMSLLNSKSVDIEMAALCSNKQDTFQSSPNWVSFTKLETSGRSLMKTRKSNESRIESLRTTQSTKHRTDILPLDVTYFFSVCRV